MPVGVIYFRRDALEVLVFATLVFVSAIAVCLAALFSWLRQKFYDLEDNNEKLNKALERNEVLAASLSEQLNKTDGPKLYQKPKSKNRVISISENELAKREKKTD